MRKQKLKVVKKKAGKPAECRSIAAAPQEQGEGFESGQGAEECDDQAVR